MWHIMPVDDLREHEFHDCWCKPVLQEEDGEQLLVHNSMDQRELYERGELRLH